MNKFLHQVQIHFNGPLNCISNDVKVNYLLLYAADDVQEIGETFDFSKEAKDVNDYLILEILATTIKFSCVKASVITMQPEL